jgi:hypothetical protein
MSNTINKLFILVIFLFAIACKNGPKIITTPIEGHAIEQKSSAKSIFSGKEEANTETKVLSNNEELHIVTTLETLNTDRYIYVRVQEDDEEYWVATAKKEIEIGKPYFFKKGLMKTNFESKEFGRNFEKLYLVSNMVPADHGGSKITPIDSDKPGKESNASRVDIIQVAGSVSIAEIVNNAKDYKNKEVQISGKCTKVNANIMGRNWIHLKDGSKDDFDMIVTTEDNVTVGQTVTMKGTVHLDVDFGAGYAYDLIIEDGVVLKQN